MSATITPFVFDNPTYIIKAVNQNMSGPIASYFYWPKSGSVDDTKNWDPTRTCGKGLYGFTIKHIMEGTPYGDFFRSYRNYVSSSAKIYLILEVEESEIVLEGDKCKVPRCNVVGCYEADEWQVFCAKWSHLLNDTPTPDDIILKMRAWVGREILTDELREDLRTWAAGNKVREAGEGCQPGADLKTFHFLKANLNPKTGEWLKEDITEERVLLIAQWMCSTTCAGARMKIWALIQKNVNLLFAVHPYIEKVMVATACGDGDDKYPIKAYANWHREQHWIVHELSKYSKADQEEIKELLKLA